MELEMLNRAISRILSSYATIRNRYVQPFPPYNGEVNGEVKIVLTMVHLKDVFNIFFSISIAGSIIFVIEYAYYRLKWINYSLDQKEMGEWKYRLDLSYIINSIGKSIAKF